MLPRCYAAFSANCATNTYASLYARGAILRGHEPHCNKNEHAQFQLSNSTSSRKRDNPPRWARHCSRAACCDTTGVYRKRFIQYGSLIGDLNPIHLEGHGAVGRDGRDSSDSAVNIDPNFFRRRSKDGRPEAIVHGMLVGSLFSSIFGTLIPGSVYRSQRLEFRHAVFANDPIVARVVVLDVRNMKGRGLLVTCDTTIASADDKLVKHVEGEATVWLPGA